MPYYDEVGRYRLEEREADLLRRLLPECDPFELVAVAEGACQTLDRLSCREGRVVGLAEFARRLEAAAGSFARRWGGSGDFTTACLAELLRQYPLDAPLDPH